MTIFLIFVHSVCCIFLIIVVLMQSGRGGGLTAEFAAAESMFGAKTNEFMIRMTTILTAVFLLTSLTLTHIFARKQASLIPNEVRVEKNVPLDTVIPAEPKSPAAETNSL